jgi:hypothetical protein
MGSRSAGGKTLPAQHQQVSALFLQSRCQGERPDSPSEVWPKQAQCGKASPLRGVTQICKHVQDRWSCAKFAERPLQPQAILFFTQVRGLCPSAILLNL